MKLRDWEVACYALTSPASAALFGTYWRQISERLGDMDLDQVRPSDIRMLANHAQQRAIQRAGHRSGVYAAEHLIAAARKLFQLAQADGLCTGNPAALVEKPNRPPSHRHALSDAQVHDLFDVATDTDTVVLRFLLETGARREGVCNLTPRTVRRERQTVVLDEKGSRTREQPISLAMRYELDDAESVLYGWTRRRMDGLWTRIRRELPWAEDLRVSSHWIRHTAVTRMEQHAGYAIAAAYAGHEAVGTTATYVHVGVTDVARAFSTLYGEPHPLAELGKAASA